MNDGGMGSVRFVGGADRQFGGVIAEGNFRDEDGTQVTVAINVDQHGELYEIDIWKVDFSPVKRIPPVEQIQIARKDNSTP